MFQALILLNYVILFELMTRVIITVYFLSMSHILTSEPLLKFIPSETDVWIYFSQRLQMKYGALFFVNVSDFCNFQTSTCRNIKCEISIYPSFTSKCYLSFKMLPGFLDERWRHHRTLYFCFSETNIVLHSKWVLLFDARSRPINFHKNMDGWDSG